MLLKTTDFPKRQRHVAVKRRQLSFWPAELRAFTMSLLVPKILAASRQSPLAYQQCASVKEDASRLACYNRRIRSIRQRKCAGHRLAKF
jgi:hypothetical protein